jgi:choline dehydrogenase-like flavoprotein
MSGIPYWTMDIGGFVVPEKFEKPNAENLEEWRELMTRWSQFGAFAPLFRSHGQFPYREIYNTAPDDHQAYKSFLYYDKLRYRLLPYIYSLAGAAYHNNYTIMRGLAMDFAKDTAVLNIADQYMFGSALLINPVSEYKQTKRSLYLPKNTGGWYDLYTGKWYRGAQTMMADALKNMPHPPAQAAPTIDTQPIADAIIAAQANMAQAMAKMPVPQPVPPQPAPVVNTTVQLPNEQTVKIEFERDENGKIIGAEKRTTYKKKE